MTIGLGSADFGWTCPGCREFVPFGESHSCGGCYQESVYPYAFETNSDFLLNLVLDEMIKKLNQILDELKEIREELA